jgi:hypothetical protein
VKCVRHSVAGRAVQCQESQGVIYTGYANTGGMVERNVVYTVDMINTVDTVNDNTVDTVDDNTAGAIQYNEYIQWIWYREKPVRWMVQGIRWMVQWIRWM